MRDTNELLKISDVCDELGISRSTWYSMARRGDAPPVLRAGGFIRVRWGALVDWMQAREGRA